jgi:hypothetical protein
MTGGRVSAVEYCPLENFVPSASKLAGVEPTVIRRAVEIQGERIRHVLGVGAAPIRLDGDTLIAEDVAGLVRLLPNLEVEIAPKFLGNAWPNWREDFLVVANIARSGQLLIRERIASSTGPRDDLASLVARTFVDLFERNRRRPLRTYRPDATEEWSLDGDIEAEELLMPAADGYRVRRLTLSGRNRHNARIVRAATLLAPEVRDGVLQRQVRRIAQRLGPQPISSARPIPRVPSRHRHWQQCYDLANEINAGFGVRLAPGQYSSPGYVLTTWLAFEHLLVAAMRIGLQLAQVSYHPRFTLGQRADGRAVIVEPDLLISHAGKVTVLDAKYKGRPDQSPSIASSDLYEALAFAEATGHQRVTLLYPRPTDGVTPSPVGFTQVFDEIKVGSRIVAGITVECRGISGRGSFLAFAKGLAKLA